MFINLEAGQKFYPRHYFAIEVVQNKLSARSARDSIQHAV